MSCIVGEAITSTLIEDLLILMRGGLSPSRLSLSPYYEVNGDMNEKNNKWNDVADDFCHLERDEKSGEMFGQDTPNHVWHVPSNGSVKRSSSSFSLELHRLSVKLHLRSKKLRDDRLKYRDEPEDNDRILYVLPATYSP